MSEQSEVMAAGPDAERLIIRQRLREFACAHDQLDLYNVPRFQSGPSVEIDLVGRIELLLDRIRKLITPEPRVPPGFVAAKDFATTPGYEHLAADAPPKAVCSECRRQSWAAVDVGEVCKMPQPDGKRCTGTFRPFPI